jgi:hypothetical protein
MGDMFLSVLTFSGDTSKWDVSSVLSMEYMFLGATPFNSDISKRDIYLGSVPCRY